MDSNLLFDRKLPRDKNLILVLETEVCRIWLESLTGKHLLYTVQEGFFLVSFFALQIETSQYLTLMSLFLYRGFRHNWPKR